MNLFFKNTKKNIEKEIDGILKYEILKKKYWIFIQMIFQPINNFEKINK